MPEDPAKASPFLGVEHIGIAVRNSERVSALMRELFDASVVETVVSEERKLRLTFLEIAGTTVELLEPREGEGPVSRFLETKGEGFHHIALAVSDISNVISRLRHAGVRLVEPAPSTGAHGNLVAFIHPYSVCGILVELCEKKI